MVMTPLRAGAADGLTGEDFHVMAAALVLIVLAWVLSRLLPVRGSRPVRRLIVCGRPVQPVAVFALLVTGGLSVGVISGSTSQGAALSGAPGLVVATVGAVACVVLTAGWWSRRATAVRSGLLLAAVTWGGTTGAALADGRTFNAFISACWAGLFLVVWLVEWTVQTHGGDRGQA